MQIQLRRVALGAALVFGVSAVAVPALAQQDENREYKGRQSSAETQRTNPDTYANHPDYSNNEYYRTGNDEGYQDYKAHRQRGKHEHQYRNGDDRRAHDYGYQEGWSGRSYRDRDDDRGSQTYSNQRHDKDDVRGSDRDRDNRTDRDRDNQKHDKDDDLRAH